MNELQRILRQYNFPKREDKISAQNEIKNIERTLHWEFPEDYKYYISNYLDHEIEINEHFVITWNILEILEVSSLNFYLEEKVLAIGGTGGGLFFGYDYADPLAPRMICSDMIGSEREYLVEIGSSFTDMYLRLENGRNWL